MFNGESDGEGMNVVVYFRLSESFSKELPLNFQENVKVRKTGFHGFLLQFTFDYNSP